jgi:hypothetical protein
MLQRIALSHALGALATTLVGVGEYYNGLSAGVSEKSLDRRCARDTDGD